MWVVEAACMGCGLIGDVGLMVMVVVVVVVGL